MLLKAVVSAPRQTGRNVGGRGKVIFLPVRPFTLSPGLLGETRSLDGFHLGPGGRNVRLREPRVVDEVQVHVFNAKLYEVVVNIPNAISSDGEW